MSAQPTLYSDIVLPRAKPALKWAGGKSQLLPVLLRAMPAGFSRYVEPFLGGGALLFHLARPGSVASDSNKELIRFYEVVRDSPGELLEAVAALPITKEHYYRIRRCDPQSLSAIERAARFVYLNKTCYNGLHRVNRKGQFNTPFGGRSDVRVVDPLNLPKASNVLKHVKMCCADYEETLSQVARGDFVYLDPPYVPLGGYSDFKRYTSSFFDDREHVRLAQQVRRIAELGALVLVSNSATERVKALYRGFHMAEVEATRQINCKPTGRGRVTELLIANYPLACGNVIS